MYYWILRSPPGYSGEQSYMVSAYQTPEPESFVRTGEQLFAVSIEEARALIPRPCQRIDRQPFAQFIELWYADPKT